MKLGHPRGTLLDIPLIEEHYSSAFAISVGAHAAFFAALILGPLLLPRPTPLKIGSGPGGGIGGEISSVGIVDDLGGGAGMVRPSLIPQPPALPADKVDKPETDTKAVPIPDETASRKVPVKKREAKAAKSPVPVKEAPAPRDNVIPTIPAPGAGGSGGLGGGSGGGRGGGVGVSIGGGSGGFGDSWYAQAVERRISQNWSRPTTAVRIEIVYSFVIYADGRIGDIRKEKSSGSEALDLAAERAIRASNPLSAPPPEYRGRPLQFMAQFVYPPGP